MQFKKIHLEPDNQLFSEVMSNNKKYIIPGFQRDYSWETTEWEELWRDIETMRETKTQHFMGYLVFQTADKKTFQVIDGQQRLTTLSLVIVAALSKLQSFIDDKIEAEENLQRIEKHRATYLDVFDLVDLSTEPKLVLNRHNNRHFRTVAMRLSTLIERNMMATNRKINRAFQYFADKFQPCRSGGEVAEILADIADGVLFTAINVRDDLNAYTVFETLNARGLHLSSADLLKNYFLSILSVDETYSEQNFLDFEERWGGIMAQLGEAEFTAFLRACRGIKNKIVSKRDLFRALRQDVDAPDKVIPYLDSITEHAPAYAALQDSNDSFWAEHGGRYEGARRHLKTLELFDVKAPLSLLMAGFDALSPQDFVTLLKHIAAVTIRYNVICAKPPHHQEQIYNQLANRLAADGATLHELTRGLKPVYPGIDFPGAFVGASISSRRSAKKILFLLMEIERQLSGNEPPASLTLEHILPYHPDDAWQEYFGRDSVEQAVDRLGNMAILPRAMNMEQQPFSEKRRVLENSPYRINQHIAEYSEWDMDAVYDHQKWLAKQAKAVWKISQLEQP